MDDTNTLKFYRSFFEAINDLEDEDRLSLYDAIMRYQFNGEEPIFRNKYLKAIWKTIVPNIDSYNKSVSEGQRGGAPIGNKNAKKQPKTTPLVLENNPPCLDKTTEEEVEEEVDVEVEEDINTPSETEVSSGDTAKASKHRYGVYKHVLLKDQELQTLQKDYPNWEELINYLDEYIEMKGYKAKSHYLCIKKWVVDAVKEKASKQPSKTQTEIANKFYDNSNIAQFKDLNRFYWNA